MVPRRCVVCVCVYPLQREITRLKRLLQSYVLCTCGGVKQADGDGRGGGPKPGAKPRVPPPPRRAKRASDTDDRPTSGKAPETQRPPSGADSVRVDASRSPGLPPITYEGEGTDPFGLLPPLGSPAAVGPPSSAAAAPGHGDPRGAGDGAVMTAMQKQLASLSQESLTLVDKLEKEEERNAALQAEVRALKDTLVAMESSALPMCTVPAPKDCVFVCARALVSVCACVSLCAPACLCAPLRVCMCGCVCARVFPLLVALFPLTPSWSVRP